VTIEYLKRATKSPSTGEDDTRAVKVAVALWQSVAD